MSSSLTNAALSQQISDLINLWRNRELQMKAWLAGTVGGGPGSDGQYPLTDYLGNSYLVESPAQQAADLAAVLASGTGAAATAAASATAAATSATAAATSATAASTSASAAATSATSASTSQGLANASAISAEAYRDLCVTYSGNASASATAAASSATAAGTSATSASTSATAAAASATAAAASAVLAATFTPSLYATLAGATFTGTVNGVNASFSGTFHAGGNTTLGGTLAVTGAISASNLSGTNTGDQNLSAYALTSSLSSYAALAGATFTGAISTTNITVSGSYQRAAIGEGWLDGGYALSGKESGSTSGAIYSIGGGTYVPGTTTLGNMYGIGYTLGNVSGISAMGQGAAWGMYVASGGAANIFLCSDTGIGYFSAGVKAPTFTGALSGNASTATSATTAGTATNWGTYGGVPTAGSVPGASGIPRADASGYMNFNYINSNTTNSENPTISQVIVTNGGDNYYRKADVSALATALGIPSFSLTNSSTGSLSLGGIIIKWGTGTATAAGTLNSYSGSFPTATYIVVWTESDGVISGAYSSSSTKTSNSGFTAFTGKGTSVGINYIAIGH